MIGFLIEESQQIPQESLGVTDQGPHQRPVPVLRHTNKRHRDSERGLFTAVTDQLEGQEATEVVEAGLEAHLKRLRGPHRPPIAGSGQRPAVNLDALDSRQRFGGTVGHCPLLAFFAGSLYHSLHRQAGHPAAHPVKSGVVLSVTVVRSRMVNVEQVTQAGILPIAIAESIDPQLGDRPAEFGQDLDVVVKRRPGGVRRPDEQVGAITHFEGEDLGMESDQRPPRVLC